MSRLGALGTPRIEITTARGGWFVECCGTGQTQVFTDLQELLQWIASEFDHECEVDLSWPVEEQ